MIVFLAVPALQRNARNTSRKEDAAGLLSGVNEFTNNNNGTTPTVCANPVSNSTVQWQLAATPYTVSNSNVGYYNAGCKTAPGTFPTSAAVATVYFYPSVSAANVTSINALESQAATSEDAIFVVSGDVCNGNALSTTGGSGRSFAAAYQIETGSGTYGEFCTSS